VRVVSFGAASQNEIDIADGMACILRHLEQCFHWRAPMCRTCRERSVATVLECSVSSNVLETGDECSRQHFPLLLSTQTSQ